LTGGTPTAVLISGGGTNLQAFIDGVATGDLDLDLRVVFSNRPSAYGLERASRAGIATACVQHGDYPDRPGFDAALVEALAPHQPQLILLAGFMRVLTPVFIGA